MKVLIVKGSDGAIDTLVAVDDTFSDERIKEVRQTVERKGGELLVYYQSSLEDFEWYIKDCVKL